MSEDVIDESADTIEDEVIEEEEVILDGEEGDDANAEEDDFSVVIGDEEEEEEEVLESDEGDEGDEEESAPKDSGVLKKMRNLYKEEKKKNRALKEKIEQSAPAPVVENNELLKKPSLDDEDIDYDKDVYEERLKEYFQSETKHNKAQEDNKRIQQEQADAWQIKVDTYNSKKKQLEAHDYEDAEEFVMESLSEVQQNIILQYAKDSALLVYALGKNKKKAQELAKITDPVEFAIQARELEGKLKVRNRAKPPAPEKSVKGSSRAGRTSDGQLEELRKKAEKTGNYTEVTAYKRKLKQRNKS